jgi:hypothetical protein
MRSALFWVVTQRVVVNIYRRFGQPIPPTFNLQEFFTLEDIADWFSRNVGEIRLD